MRTTVWCRYQEKFSASYACQILADEAGCLLSPAGGAIDDALDVAIR